MGSHGHVCVAGDDRRRAFTLVELLVVIAIIGTLVGLLLPAVQVARESARRSTCQNKVKQLVLGVLNRVDAQGTFPMGAQTWLDNAGPTIDGITYGNRRWSWFVYVLPFVEEQSMYDAQWKVYSSSTFQTVPALSPATSLSYLSLPQKATAVPSFMCPSDPTNPKLNSQDGPASSNNQGFHGNYVLSAGNQTYGTTSAGTAQLNGLSFPLSAVKLKDVTDGLSKTVAVSEIMLIPEPVGGAVDTRGRYHNNMHGGCNFSTLNQPNTTVNDRLPYCSNAVATAPCQGGSGTNHVIAARSYHPGGVNAAMADGAVRFVPNEISVQIWQAVGSRSGGEIGNVPE